MTTVATMPTILDSLSDPHLLGALPAFRDLTTWRPWRVFLSAFYGLPLDVDDLALFQRYTGRTAPRPGGYAEAVAITGRQSGKTQIAAAVGVHEAAGAALRGDRGVFIPLVAQDLRGAQRALMGYARQAFEASPMLKREITRDTASELELSRNVTLGVYPCRPASVRGIRAPLVLLDELAFYLSTEGNPVDREMLRAVRPTLATTRGRLLILSSPYAAVGALFDLHRAHYGRDESTTLVWVASAPDMNPTLPADYLARMEADDPEAFRSEVLGEFRTGLATLLEPEAIAACVAKGVRARDPQQGIRYETFVDAASGSGKDAFTVGVAHQDGDHAVLDVVQAWKPPFNPTGVMAEAAELIRRYGRVETVGDRFAAGFVVEGFRANGITYRPSEKDRSAIYLELLPAVNSGRAVLLDDPDLLRELRGLERRRGTSGRDRVDHRAGAHDDRSNAAAGALLLVATPAPKAYMKPMTWRGDAGTRWY